MFGMFFSFAKERSRKKKNTPLLTKTKFDHFDILVRQKIRYMRSEGNKNLDGNICPAKPLFCTTTYICSSQYIDEDGDVAHEFYAEHQSQDGQVRRLYRVVNNLRPKGYERYAIPRLSPDVPVVMWEVEQQS
ncbi:hypothetical protein TELCIR_11334 [Teladorsagia circumcincta]|uniref:Uncharacterized protein n=1 Tax=Teladorsagia circumcincta TaxID=45464 RepID=A0A2G9U9J3_TELCI|nr:hypothetical protein TELCIR_11334 [Teladorsagia circumcincta]